MTRLVLLAAAVGTVWGAGCGPKVGTRPDPIDVTATVTGPDGKPLPATLAVVLQPTGDQMMTRLTKPTAAGPFAGKAMPGQYMYYIAPAKGEGTPKDIPAKHTSASEEFKVEVAAGKPIEIALSK